ncbi:acyl-CoA thioesterase [Pseudonocardia acidicola]|uniref:Acyl-CoA thioesterase n=1 Tax=Pseudonocardia acidicola TaxID=2724939 RepID=A0ABX1SF63_9PSEU|nr:acyl-CoA thioesterase [Pseudonocardia acidicola]NMI00195.1 acyl-CoA thioesterase [Pseudonocardia acidicola]
MDGRAAEYLATARRRVAMGDVDAAGILYFAAPYRWLEELFTGWLKDAGHPVSAMLRSQVACPCVASAATYLAPLSLDDEITLTLQPSSIGTTSFAVTAEARRVDDGAVAVRATGWHVWAAFDGPDHPNISPQVLPGWLQSELTSIELTQPCISERSRVSPDAQLT